MSSSSSTIRMRTGFGISISNVETSRISSICSPTSARQGGHQPFHENIRIQKGFHRMGETKKQQSDLSRPKRAVDPGCDIPVPFNKQMPALFLSALLAPRGI